MSQILAVAEQPREQSELFFISTDKSDALVVATHLSLNLKARRADYCRLLQEAHQNGAWAAWLELFLNRVAETANKAFDAGRRIADLFAKDRARIATESEWAGSTLRIHDLLQ